MIRKKTVLKFIGHLNNLVESGLTRSAYCVSHDMCSSYFSVTFTSMLNAYKAGDLSIEDFNEIIELMSKVDSRYVKYKESKQILQDAVELVEEVDRVKTETNAEETLGEIMQTVDEEADDARNTINFERDDQGKIKSYYCKVLIRDKEPLIARLTRDEMNMIYRLYSYYGQSITQREVSRYFPQWSLQDFKRILRVFSITKASSPFAPHMIEEYSPQELTEIQLREKENDFLRKLEAERVKNNEKLLVKYAQENADLKRQLRNSKDIVSSIDVSGIGKLNFCPVSQENNEFTLFIWLSDMHVGAHVANESLYDNSYDLDVVQNRLATIVQTCCGYYKEIVVCNIGDSLDGQDGYTVKRTHQLPQNMTNKEQVNGFIQAMTMFFETLAPYCDKLSYYCVGDSNHDGILGYTANLALGEILKAKGISATVYNSFIGYFKHKDTTYVLCHGKDGKDMFKNWPLTLDLKTENYINEYLDHEGITGKVVVVKGDLHQSAISYGRRFKYMSVGSLFGSSEWIHKNFGFSPAVCDYSVVDDLGNMLDGRIVLQ